MAGMKDVKFFAYIGSKRRLMDKLVPMFPNGCKDYYEACGGSGYVALNLPSFEMPKEHKTTYKPFKKIVYNEYNAHVCKLFELMQDTSKSKELIERLVAIENNKENFEKCLASYKADFADITDDIEKAVMTFTVITQSRYNAMESYEKSKKASDEPDKAEQRLEKLRQRLESVASVLQQNDIKITCGDCFKMVEEHFDDPSCFIYIDPPYLGQNRYKLDWSFSMHAQFAELCNEAKCKIMISSRDNGIYNEVLARYKPETDVWHKYYLGSFRKTQNSPDGKLIGAWVYLQGYVSPNEFINDEYIYTNYEASADLEACNIREYDLFASRLIKGDEVIMIEGKEPKSLEF